MLGARALILIFVLSGLWAYRQNVEPTFATTGVVCSLLLLGVLLAGSLNEVSYTLILMPGMVLAVIAGGRTERSLLVAAATLLFAPLTVTRHLPLGSFHIEVLYVVAELLVLIAFASCLGVPDRVTRAHDDANFA